MTVSSVINKHVYAGNGTNTTWPYTFKLSDASHVHVYIQAPDGDPTEITAGFFVDTANKCVVYPVTAENPEDQIPVLVAGSKIILLRAVPYVQELDIENQGVFSADSIEDQFDLVVMMIQQLGEESARALKVGMEEYKTPDQLMTELFEVQNAAEAAKAGAETAETGAVEAKNAAEAAQSAAETAETNAETAEAGAIAAKTAAQMAQSAAETAETNAETAETGAIAAKNAAEEASADAATARQIAVSASGTAVSAKNDAISAKNEAVGAKTVAEAAETGAITAKTAAEAAQTAAETAETNAETASATAQKWAEENEDTEVIPGLYSAKHWAAKAQDFAELGYIDWLNIGNKPDTFPPSEHNHDALYAVFGHDHTGVYAGVNHDHAIGNITGLQTALDDKAAAGHNHDSLYAAITHDHTGVYSASDHNHDLAYAAAIHTHSYLANVSEDTTPELGGPLDCNNALVYWDLYSISGTTIDVANGNKQKLTLSTTNITVTLETPSGACAFHLFIYQGFTARTITWPTIKWLDGTAPVLSVSNGRFVVCLAWDGASWFGSWGAYS